jgi:hypothetical protein
VLKSRKLIAIATTIACATLSLLFVATPAQATSTCDGLSCYGLDPSSTYSSIDGIPCSTGAYTPTGAVLSAPPGYLELRYGPHCHANWAKITSSSAGTFFYVASSNGYQSQGFTVPSGSTSGYTNMVTGYPTARACDSAGCTGWY